MKPYSASPLSACNPCRQLSSSSSSDEMSSCDDRRQDMLAHQIFREADGLAPMERSVDEVYAAHHPSASSPHHQESQLSEDASPFFAITRANPISSYDSYSNGATDMGATYSSEHCEDDDEMSDRTYHHDIIERQVNTAQEDDVLRRYNNTSPLAAPIDFSPFFRPNPAPVTPHHHASETVVLSTEQSVLADQIQPNFFTSAAANTPSNTTTLLLGEGQNGRRSFSPSGVTEIQNQRGRDGGVTKAPTTPTTSNVQDDANFSTSGQQQQRNPFRSRQHQDDDPQDDQQQRQHLEYLQQPLIHTSWTSTTDGSTIVSSHRASGIDRSSSSLLCSSISAESCSFDVANM